MPHPVALASERPSFRDGSGHWTVTQRGACFVGTTANETYFGRGGNDNIAGGGGCDNLFGQNGSDTISGGDGNDTITGGSKSDVLSGDAGDDSIGGGSGHDVINGGAGNDTLAGGFGGDTLTGSDGADVFKYVDINDTGDVIMDFDVDEDTLDLTALNATNVNLFQVGSDTVVQVDADNNVSSAELEVTLKNVLSTDVSDNILS